MSLSPAYFLFPYYTVHSLGLFRAHDHLVASSLTLSLSTLFPPPSVEALPNHEHLCLRASKTIIAAGLRHLLGHHHRLRWLFGNSIALVITSRIKCPLFKYGEGFLFSWLDLNDPPFDTARLKLPERRNRLSSIFEAAS